MYILPPYAFVRPTLKRLAFGSGSIFSASDAIETRSRNVCKNLAALLAHAPLFQRAPRRVAVLLQRLGFRRTCGAAYLRSAVSALSTASSSAAEERVPSPSLLARDAARLRSPHFAQGDSAILGWGGGRGAGRRKIGARVGGTSPLWPEDWPPKAKTPARAVLSPAATVPRGRRYPAAAYRDGREQR